MANTYRGEVTVCVAGRAYTLRPTFHILCQLEERIGLTVPALLQRVQKQGLLASEILMILAVATRHDGSEWFDSAKVMELPADKVDLHGLMPAIARFLLGGVATDAEGKLDYGDWLAYGCRVLRLRPADFWALTVAELRQMMPAPNNQHGMAEDMQTLMRRYPDHAA